MTLQIAAVLLILAVALVFFITEKLRMDVVALLVLATLAASGLVSLPEALAGFSNPAVVTVWAMFILSAGLSSTGVAEVIGQKVLRLAGRGEARMIIVIMLTTGVLSAFMNNIGVAALMLPVVMEIARRTHTSPSRLLMPMAYASLLGGLTTLVGTPPNLVASTSLRAAGLEGFSLFEFTPIGLPALVIGTLFVAFVGRHLLPAKMPEGMNGRSGGGLRFSYDLEERRFRLRVIHDSPLCGRPLREARLSAILGLNVVAVHRGRDIISNPGPSLTLESNDLLTVQGRVENFREFLSWQALEVATGADILNVLSREKITVLTAVLATESDLVGRTIQEADFRSRFGVNILEVRKAHSRVRSGLRGVTLEAGDTLVLEGRRGCLEELGQYSDFLQAAPVPSEEFSEVHPESEMLIELMIPPESHLTGKTLGQSGLGETLRLRIVGIVRKGGGVLFPSANEIFNAGDQLLAVGGTGSFEMIRAIQGLELLDDSAMIADEEEDREEQLVEVTLSPQTTLSGKSLRDLDFRQRYGLQVLSIWRRGRAYRSHLRHMLLEFGDALLLSGPREKIALLTQDPDFLVISGVRYDDVAQPVPGKAILSASLMLAVVVAVLFGLLPIAIAAVAGAALMVALKCLTMENAYRAIEWKSVFLIAGMIPLGTAMESSGAAKWIAEGVSLVAQPFGLWGILAGIYFLTALATTIVPTTALVLIMAPIAISTSSALSLDPKLLMMAVAMAASASFTSPISHPANVLVMGPGGYRFVDYMKMGVILALAVALTVLPLIVLVYR